MSQVVDKRTPTLRYHKSCIGGKLFKYEDALEKAEAEGWVDHPGKITKLPGHEKLFNSQNVTVVVPPVAIVVITENKPECKSEDTKKADALKAASDLAERQKFGVESPPANHVCLVCGKSFDKLNKLNMHGISAHRKKKDLTPEEVQTVKEGNVA